MFTNIQISARVCVPKYLLENQLYTDLLVYRVRYTYVSFVTLEVGLIRCTAFLC